MENDKQLWEHKIRTPCYVGGADGVEEVMFEWQSDGYI